MESVSSKARAFETKKTTMKCARISPSYFCKNFCNKVLTGLKIFHRICFILVHEILLHAQSWGLALIGKKKPRRFSQSVFRLGLDTTGSRLSTRFQFKTQYCRERQLLLLKDILEENKDTEFGKKHNFENIKSIDDFQFYVPVNTYDSLEDYVTRQTNGEPNIIVKGSPISYATTSGTTGSPKFIPITKRAQLESHQNISRIFTHSIYQECPEAYDGTILTIVSPAEEGQTPDGTVFGSTSGQLILSMNKVVKDKYTIPYGVLTLDDYEARNYCILLLGINSDVTMLSTANPSTLSLLAKQGNEWKDRLIDDTERGCLDSSVNLPQDIRDEVNARLNPAPQRADQLRLCIYKDPENKLRPRHYFDHLNLITCWTGGNSGVFLRELRSWYGEVNIRDLGYLASEIRGSIPLHNHDPSGVLTIGENFFEFVKASDIDHPKPKFYLADELTVGERYYIFFTTKSGLYRYNINDIIEVTGYRYNTPKIIFIQKGKGVTNLTGEKLYEQQLLASVEKVESQTGITTNFFICQANSKKTRYDFYCEFSQEDLSEIDQDKFIQTLESELCNINIEYAVKRKSLRLRPIALFRLAPKSFEAYKGWRIKNGVREAQFKITPLVQEYDFLDALTVLDSVILDEVKQDA